MPLAGRVDWRVNKPPATSLLREAGVSTYLLKQSLFHRPSIFISSASYPTDAAQVAAPRRNECPVNLPWMRASRRAMAKYLLMTVARGKLGLLGDRENNGACGESGHVCVRKRSA